jgi:hypothetical protein
MDAILKFTLPEEQDYFEDAVKGRDWKIIVLNIENYLRTQIKHSEDYDSIKGLEMAQEKLWELISESNCTI